VPATEGNDVAELLLQTRKERKRIAETAVDLQGPRERRLWRHPAISTLFLY
jgi:hypothetical protein